MLINTQYDYRDQPPQYQPPWRVVAVWAFFLVCICAALWGLR